MARAWLAPADASRDRRVEDPSNIWIVHAAGRLLLPVALRLGIPANAISLAGLGLGIAAAVSFYAWSDWRLATAGFLLCIGWLIADGLDGMVARASGTTSALGRVLDGLCDHAVFLLVYVALAASFGTLQAWLLAIASGMVRAVQASLYEGERMRYHRRLRARPPPPPPVGRRNQFVRFYDGVAGSMDRLAIPLDRVIADAVQPELLAALYGERAVPPMRLMALLSNNMRVLGIYIACLAGDPRLFLWFQLIPLSLLAAAGILWLRRVEAAMLGERGARGA